MNCLGALDETYIKVNVPAGDRPTFRTRKGEIATNVLGVVQHERGFRIRPRRLGRIDDRLADSTGCPSMRKWTTSTKGYFLFIIKIRRFLLTYSKRINKWFE
uniref:Nuclease HARBI1 n=1 Tax=Cucumis melo TaxID=3656 RepID=A0A9I9ECC3_CUCME